MSLGPHHQELRKRIYKNLEPFPHPDPVKRFLDKLIFVVGFLGPVSTVPQIWTIFVDHDASGVSMLSWSLYAFFSIIWIIYGILHKEKAIIFTYSLWTVMEGLVVLGTIVH
jgi:uncharacterized protein with PQ loop repeat